jgi:hypothetical protein
VHVTAGTERGASDPRALRLEGNYRSTATPFEMYVEDGIVFAMFNAYYTY